MATNHANNEQDFLRARFTSWLDTVLYHAKLRYLHNERQKMETVSLDAFPADLIQDPNDCFEQVAYSQTDFDFEEEKLAKAFYELPLMRREVLRLIFVEEKSNKEIASQLHCSEEYVRLQKFRALKKLRQQLEDGGDGSRDNG